jgi:hypothetical protein
MLRRYLRAAVAVSRLLARSALARAQTITRLIPVTFILNEGFSTQALAAVVRQTGGPRMKMSSRSIALRRIPR